MTRHFHATFLIFIGVLVLFFLALALGKAPHFTPPKLASTSTISITPTPTPQTAFLYGDNTGSYQSISAYSLATSQKQGMYGEPTTPTTSYTSFKLFNNQIYLQAVSSAAIINISNHFFYPISVSQIPFTVSPSSTKALFIIGITNPKTKIQTKEFKLQTSTSTTSATLSYPTILGNSPQPLCWSHDENTVVFSNPQKELFYYSLTNQHAKQATLSAPLNQATNIYCNSATDTLYFITQSGVYKKGFTETTPRQLPVTPAIFALSPVFSSTLPDTVLVGTGSALLQVDLDKNQSKQLYIATDSATLIPYLWQGSTIVYTQQSTKPEKGVYYLAGKELNTTNQVDTIFARHQASTTTSLGNITPIGWIEDQGSH